MSHISNAICQRGPNRMVEPIVIEDDDEEVQEVTRPLQRRSTQTPGMFMTPNLSEIMETSTNGRRTVDLTEEPELGPMGRYRSRGTTDSGGLFVRQSHSEPNSSTTPENCVVPVQIDLTQSDDEEGTEEYGQTTHTDASNNKGESGDDKKPPITPISVGESRGIKRPRSSSAAVSEPANIRKRQMNSARHTPQSC